MKKIIFDSLTIFEWYDGLVRGIGKSNSRSYLIVLFRWDTGTSIKDYALFELDSKARIKFNSLFKKSDNSRLVENWDEFESVYSEFLSRYTGRVLVLHGELEKGQVNSVDILDMIHLPNLEKYDLSEITF